ncbi:MAG: rod shape-determining protein MreC, partial [Candidatus Doudnabacteria bacterium]|nr:rod shape-determining protein MreC [Candidatus Doudnabacteria bacterium]
TQTLLLSCGTEQGVVVGQGVVSQGYLIGKVVLATARNATIRLVTAPSTAVDVRVANRQASGVLRGSFGSGLELDFISDTSGVAVGDLVTTAGVNARIPPDVLIGSVAHVEKKAGALFSQVTVKSPVDLRDIRFVHVLQP